jgi:hypothetical protein
MGLLDFFRRGSQEEKGDEGNSFVGDEATLGRIDVYSPTWVYVRSWARERLQALREMNDSMNKSETQTAAIRGEIRAMKEILALPEEKRIGLLSNGIQDED